MSFAARKGYRFSVDEAKAHTRARARAVGKELGDAELDGLAGGPLLVLVGATGRQFRSVRLLITADTGRLGHRGVHDPAKDDRSYVGARIVERDQGFLVELQLRRGQQLPSWSRLVALTIGAVIDLRRQQPGKGHRGVAPVVLPGRRVERLEDAGPCRSRTSLRSGWRPGALGEVAFPTGTCRRGSRPPGIIGNDADLLPQAFLLEGAFEQLAFKQVVVRL